MPADDHTPESAVTPRPIDRAALATIEPESESLADKSPAAEPTVPDSGRRRAMWISTAIAVPVTVLLAFALTVGRGTEAKPTATGTVTVASLPVQDAATSAACNKAVKALPVALDGMQLRVTTTAKSADAGQIAAWGDPPVILRCGVARPAGFVAGSDADVFYIGDGTKTVGWLQSKVGKNIVATAIDRAAYIELTIPTSYQGASVITPVSSAIAGVFPAICVAGTDGTTDPSTLCDHRK